MTCTGNHNYHLVARRHYILTTQGDSHECTRPTPIQLATVVSSQQLSMLCAIIDNTPTGLETCKRYWLLAGFVPPSITRQVSLGETRLGMRQLCWNNFGHNRYVWESGIMLAF